MNDHNLLGKVIDAAFWMMTDKTPNLNGFTESFKTTQIKCKSWLVEEISNTNTHFNNVLVVGSWNGVLLYELMKKNCDVDWFDFLDKDESTHLHRNIYFEIHNMEKNYTSLKYDANNFSDYDKYDLIINTSCEHMLPLPTINGPLYALQSNNYTTIKEHTNCVSSTKELKKQYNITQTVYEDKLNMGHYERFMVIGSHW